jgi:hypothetical protein
LGELATTKVGVKDAFAAMGWELPSGFISNGNKNGGKLVLRGVNECAHTITASHSLVFSDSAGRSVRCVKPVESAVLVGFPQSWRLPSGSKAAQRAAGNAISPSIAKAIAAALVALTDADLAPPPRVAAAESSDGAAGLRAAVDALRELVDEQRVDIDELHRAVRRWKRKLRG